MKVAGVWLCGSDAGHCANGTSTERRLQAPGFYSPVTAGKKSGQKLYPDSYYLIKIDEPGLTSQLGQLKDSLLL